jgi:hypothetical protein
MNPQQLCATALALGIAASGCTLRRSVLATRTTLGVEVLSDPPSTTVAYTREEGAIAHTYDGGQTPPLMATFGNRQKGWPFSLSSRAASGFAGGAAAYSLAQQQPPAKESMQSPEQRGAVVSNVEKPEPQNAFLPGVAKALFGGFFGLRDEQQVFFGTDTTYGLKAGISTVNLYPNLKMGLSRREFASAPQMKSATNGPTNYIEITPFLASFNNRVDLDGRALTNHPALRRLSETEKALGRTNFLKHDLVDPIGLALKLKSFPDRVSVDLRTWAAASTQASKSWANIAKWAQGESPVMRDDIRTNLLEVLNGYLNAPANYSRREQTFADVAMSDRTRQLERWAVKDGESRKMRSLLQDAYPELANPEEDRPHTSNYLQQYFAVGESAVALSLDPAIREIVRSQLSPGESTLRLEFSLLQLDVINLVNSDLPDTRPADVEEQNKKLETYAAELRDSLPNVTSYVSGDWGNLKRLLTEGIPRLSATTTVKRANTEGIDARQWLVGLKTTLSKLSNRNR